ncbi:MAG: hypothetical protein U0W40_07670 [Acidimicrobiia bacterium]
MFSGDEWDFVVKQRGLLGDSTLGLFEPHNEHWVSGAILVYAALFSVFGVRTHAVPRRVVPLPGRRRAPALADHAAGGRADPRHRRRKVFVVLGGLENLLNAFQIAFVAPVAFGLLALLLMPRKVASAAAARTAGSATCSR